MTRRSRAAARLHAGHQVSLLQGANEYFASQIRDIEHSVQAVWMETYIFNLDVLGTQLAVAMEGAAARGVRVYLTMDGFGTPRLPNEWVERFERSGVSWRIFSPLGRVGLFLPSRWRRLHRKLCVVDAKVAYIGGINVLDDSVDLNHGPLAKPRLDFGVRVTGPLVLDTLRTMNRFWQRQTLTARILAADTRGDALLPDTATAVDQNFPSAGARARLLLRDNVRNRTAIEKAYLRALGDAREEILIANAYFLPGARLRRALVHAARRGVRVRLLLQGRYEYFLQFHAARPLYGALLDAGVEIHEYAASFMHAKVAVVDSHWATVGSSNLDPLSLLLAREANIVVDDVEFARTLRVRLERAMEQGGAQLNPAAFTGRPRRQRILEALASAATRIGLFFIGRRY